MHRVILQPTDGKQTDHINHNTLDNRRQNLREATPLENSRNKKQGKGKSRYKGVSPVKGRWIAQIGIGGQNYIGSYKTEIDAAKAYDAAAMKHFGEFARLNFTQGGQQ